MDSVFPFVLSILTRCWTWLTSWSFHGVPFAYYIMGISIMSILLRAIFGG